jgi:hypothetical protein
VAAAGRWAAAAPDDQGQRVRCRRLTGRGVIGTPVAWAGLAPRCAISGAAGFALRAGRVAVASGRRPDAFWPVITDSAAEAGGRSTFARTVSLSAGDHGEQARRATQLYAGVGAPSAGDGQSWWQGLPSSAGQGADQTGGAQQHRGRGARQQPHGPELPPAQSERDLGCGVGQRQVAAVDQFVGEPVQQAGGVRGVGQVVQDGGGDHGDGLREVGQLSCLREEAVGVARVCVDRPRPRILGEQVLQVGRGDGVDVDRHDPGGRVDVMDRFLDAAEGGVAAAQIGGLADPGCL